MNKHTILVTITATAALLAGAQASAAVLTMTAGTPSLTGVSASGTATSSSATYGVYINSDYATTTSTKIEKDVVTAPTATTAGQAYVYEVTTVATKRTDTLAWQDQLSWTQSLTGNTLGNEYVTFSATLNATQDLTASVFVQSTGSFQAQTSPFGSSVPALPSFYVRSGGSSTWTPLSGSSETNTADSTFFSAGYGTLDLTKNVSKSFEVAVFAGSNVDLKQFSVNLSSGAYGEHTTIIDLPPLVTRTLVGAELLAPVPEPETYALLAAGLLFVALRLRNQRR